MAADTSSQPRPSPANSHSQEQAQEHCSQRPPLRPDPLQSWPRHHSPPGFNSIGTTSALAALDHCMRWRRSCFSRLAGHAPFRGFCLLTPPCCVILFTISLFSTYFYRFIPSYSSPSVSSITGNAHWASTATPCRATRPPVRHLASPTSTAEAATRSAHHNGPKSGGRGLRTALRRRLGADRRRAEQQPPSPEPPPPGACGRGGRRRADRRNNKKARMEPLP